jgi:hypothetical protein
MPGTSRSGGQNRKSAEVHALHGTWRRDRHQSATTAAQAKAVTPAAPPAELLDGLGPDGRRFLEAAYRDFELSSAEGYVMRIAAQQYDDAAVARAAGDFKTARAAGRLFLIALQRLGLPATERV